MSKLRGKNITLCLTGAISAYKGLELARLLVRAGAIVSPVMTESAARFVSPLSLGVLAGAEVFTDVFTGNSGGREAKEGGYVRHIDVAQGADLVVIAPATANIIGKIGSGLADCPVSLVAMATRAPILIAPSMNTAMWENVVVQKNVKSLKSRGCVFVGPEYGDLACNTTGMGRISEPATILGAMEDMLTEKDLAGEKVLITAGPTREHIDPVRFLSNASSGRMGYALAREARRRGAGVRLISGPVAMDPPSGVEFNGVSSAAEMREAALAAFGGATLVISSAAVSDFRPEKTLETKIKKTGASAALRLVPTLDILKEMGARKRPGQILIGFALETDNLLENATKKLREKNLDMIIANRPEAMSSETGRVMIITAGDGPSGIKAEEMPEAGKDRIAEWVLERAARLRSRAGTVERT